MVRGGIEACDPYLEAARGNSKREGFDSKPRIDCLANCCYNAAVAKRGASESLVVEVYEKLRADIYDGRLAPSERLKPVELALRFGVSVSVLREALGLLAAQNLVRIERNRGFHVVSLSPTALAHLTGARKINEGAALRLSIERGGVAWESELLAAHHRMANEPIYLPENPGVRNKVWVNAHIAFHYKLIEACGNPVLLDICVRLSDAAELYRGWSGRGGETTRDIAGEHRALIEAALAHNAQRAVELYEEHVDRTMEILLELDELGKTEAAS
jgi:DNA-binding GntR family transcriptional regulator